MANCQLRFYCDKLNGFITVKPRHTMRLLVVGAGMMGSAAAYDMARSPAVERVTLVDAEPKRAAETARRMNQLSRSRKIRGAQVEAEDLKTITRLMGEHHAALSCVPYFFNLGLAKAAIQAGCHFADLGGNNTVVRQELALDGKAARKGAAIAPDCGLSPGMASILAGELMRRVGGRAEALQIYVGGLPVQAKPPFKYQLVFSANGLINEYVEPCRILRKGKIREIEPLTEPEIFVMPGFPPLDAFHTSGGTSTLVDTFQGKVGECFEKTLRYSGHYAIVRSLYDLGLFSSKPVKLGKDAVVPRRLMTKLFEEKLSGGEPDLVIMRVEAHRKKRVAAFTLVDRYDPKTKMTAMMRTTAWPASVVLQMLVSGEILKRGSVRQETDVPFDGFSRAMANRGIAIQFSDTALEELPANVTGICAGA
jgi:lysine 6-dehydrogenase